MKYLYNTVRILVLASLLFLASCNKDKNGSGNKYLVSYEVRNLTYVDVKNYLRDHYYVFLGEGNDEFKVTEQLDSLFNSKMTYEEAATEEVTLYTIVYRTPSNGFGPETLCSGIITVPKGRPYKRQVLSFHQTWMANRDFPSVAGFSLESFLSFGENIVIVPDFMGYGTSVQEPFPYMHIEQNFRTNADMLFAAWELFKEIGIDEKLPLMVIGYSQGGYDALDFQYLAEKYYPDEIKMKQVIAGGTPMNVNRMMDYVIENDYIEAEVPPILIMLGMDAAMNLGLDFNYIFTGELADKYSEWILSKKYNKREIEGFLAANKRPSKYLHPDFFTGKGNDDINKLYENMSEVSIPSNWAPQSPLLIVHGTNDSICYLEAALPDYENLKRNGKDVKIQLIQGTKHVQTYIFFALNVFAFCW